MAAALSFTSGRGALRSPVMATARDTLGGLGGPGGLGLRGALAAGGSLGTPAASGVGAAGNAGAAKDVRAKARAQAEDFEAVFLNSMFSEMMTGIDGEGPFGGGTGVSVWRSFLTEEYAKSYAKAGGIGLADDVYRSLIQQQEASLKPIP